MSKKTKIAWESLPLGEMSDVDLARQLGISARTVSFWRRRLNISKRSLSLKRDTIDWDNQPLGKMSDKALGFLLGVSYNIVNSERTKRGIATFRSSFEEDWDSVGLGALSDRDIAKKMGLPLEKVQNARLQKGIPNPTPRVTPNIDWDAQPLGRVSDSSLAKSLNVGIWMVSTARKQRNIPRSDLICLTTELEQVNYPEACIDLYWHKTGQAHQAQVTIGKYRVDWLFPNKHVVEYAGYADHPSLGAEYKVKLYRKLEDLISQGYTTKIIWPCDLPLYSVQEEPQFAEAKKCIICGKKEKNTIRARCKLHYNEWLILEHSKLPLSERLGKLRKPLREIYLKIASCGKTGRILFDAKGTQVFGGSPSQSIQGLKRRTLEILSEYALLQITRISFKEYLFEVLEATCIGK